MAPPESPVRVVRLRHGVAVRPRGDGFLQVGLDPAHRVLLPDTPAVGRALTQLRDGVVAGGECPAAVLRALGSAGLLVDVAEARLLSEARAATRVAVLSPDVWHQVATETVRTAGLQAVAVDQERDLTWILSAGEPSRDLSGPLIRDDEPVLYVSIFDTRVRVGPFVLPGTTACLGCIDAQTEIQAPPPAGPESWGLPDDVSPLLVHRAVITAADDLCAWAEGRQPATWSSTHWWDGLFTSTQERWERHPHCGCSWADSMAG